MTVFISPQMRSPAMSSQGFTSLPLAWRHFATLPWRMPDYRTGFRVALSVVSSIDLLSIHDSTASPVAQRAHHLVAYSGCLLGTILRPGVEGGRCPFASGTPTTRGAHNSETSRRRPDLQWLGLRIHHEPTRRSAFKLTPFTRSRQVGRTSFHGNFSVDRIGGPIMEVRLNADVHCASPRVAGQRSCKRMTGCQPNACCPTLRGCTTGQRTNRICSNRCSGAGPSGPPRLSV